VTESKEQTTRAASTAHNPEAERVLIVSNRLPISVSREGGSLTVTKSAGGLAAGVARVHNASGGLWIGWSGLSESLPADEEKSLQEQFAALRVVAVPLSSGEVKCYYEEYSNGILWPLFHYLIGQLPPEVQGFETYEQVNQRFADAVVANYQKGDLIWIHDYQLMLVPQMIRQKVPEARIGFFLHIPFPSSEVFRTLPYRERFIQGLMGADLIGFHTAAFMRHFSSTLLRSLGVGTEVDQVSWEGRSVLLGVFPMGADADKFDQLGRDPEVMREASALTSGGKTKILLGVDRLDYTKGINRRLLAFERLLLEHPELGEQVRLVQVAVPSRENVEAYQELREEIDGLIGRIHGTFATPSWVPIHYIYRGLPEKEIAALYRAADVMLVTPIRDGMNLVAKEFVATRSDERGVLVLSEFAGASAELPESLVVNPFDQRAMADAYYRALTMGEEQQQSRMQAMRRRVMRFGVQRWADAFLAKLRRGDDRPHPVEATLSAEGVQRLVRRISSAERLVLLLDYDGTLTPIVDRPELAKPNEELRNLLKRLADRPNTDVHIVSGRSRDDLLEWLGDLPIFLHGEHGLWRRPPGEAGYSDELGRDLDWMKPAAEILQEYADRTPGCFVEAKPAGLAWHYRLADPDFGPVQANELRLHLTQLLSNEPLEILPGDKVIELRSHGVNKGRVVALAAAEAPDALCVAIGDDRTDEDMFAALPPGGIAIHVGPSQTRAPHRIGKVEDVHAALRMLVD
jgi:trehalose 6-phosphate synthase/phosphatase